MHAIIKALEGRYATKKFDIEKKVSDTDISTIKESLRLTPSSFGLQPWKFLIIQDEATKQKLFAESMEQKQITTCSHLIVLCARTDIDEKFVDYFIDYNISHGADTERSEQYRLSLKKKIDTLRGDNILDAYANNQVYIALWNLVTTCALLGIDACPMGWFHPSGYDTILDLKRKNLRSVVICAVGYRDATDSMASRPKIRFPLKEVISNI